MARPRGFHPATGRSRRRTGWEEGPGSSTLTSFTVSGSAILGSGLTLLQDGLTLVRSRGSLEARLQAASTIPSGFHCAIGIGVVTADAFGIGITAVPIPISNVDWNGWLFHQFFDFHIASLNNSSCSSSRNPSRGARLGCKLR